MKPSFWAIPDYAAIVLDLGLPQLDGVSVLRRWRAAGRNMPVLVLTAHSEWTEKVEGIEAGADDYLAKPFIMPELIAQIRALLRRFAGNSAAKITIGRLTLDTSRISALVDGNPIRLSPCRLFLCQPVDHRAVQVNVTCAVCPEADERCNHDEAAIALRQVRASHRSRNR